MRPAADAAGTGDILSVARCWSSKEIPRLLKQARDSLFGRNRLYRRQLLGDPGPEPAGGERRYHRRQIVQHRHRIVHFEVGVRLPVFIRIAELSGGRYTTWSGIAEACLPNFDGLPMLGTVPGKILAKHQRDWRLCVERLPKTSSVFGRIS